MSAAPDNVEDPVQLPAAGPATHEAAPEPKSAAQATETETAAIATGAQPAAPTAEQDPADDHHNIQEATVGSMIEAGNTSDVSEDEFDPENWSDGGSTASTSITSSIYAHTYENGRRYHSYKHGRYPIPNDDLEQSREDMKHAMTLELTDGKLFYSPIGDNPQKILDIGTGTGIWAIEVGDLFPSATVTGIDLSPIQPVWVPPNVKFIIDDCEDEWLNGDDFDFVHLRTMSCVLKDPAKLIRQAFPHIKPGGWMEWQELNPVVRCDDGTMAPNDTLKQFYELNHKVFEKLGLSMKAPAKVGDWLREAGYVNVQCIIKKVPVGTWPADKTLRLCGMYMKTAIQEVVPSLTGKPFQIYGLSNEEREVWKATVVKSLEDPKPHRYWQLYFWFAQKPE